MQRVLYLCVLVSGLLLAGCVTPERKPDVILEQAHGGGTELAFDPSARLLASGGWSGRLRLWRVPGGEAVRSWRAHDAEITGIAFVADGSRILSTGLDGSMVVQDLDGRVQVRRQADSDITAMAVDEPGGLVVTGHHDGSVRLWSLAALEPMASRALHTDSVRAVAVHGASGWFASSDSDAEVYLWRRDGNARKLPPPSTDLRTLAFAPDGRWLYGAGWFRLLRWSVPEGGRQSMKTEHFGIINSIWFTDDGSRLASISRQTDSSVLFLDPETGATVQRLQRHDLCGAAVRVSGDGRFVATTSDDGSVRIWDLLSPQSPESR